MKCRQNPFDEQSIASILTTGVANLYSKDCSLQGKLTGLDGESFCLDWNKSAKGMLLSAVGKEICVWDVEKNLGGDQLMKIMNAHSDKEVNDAKFSPLQENLILSSGADGMFKM